MPLHLSKGSRAGLGIAPKCSQQISRQVRSGKQVCGQAGISEGHGQAQHTCHGAPAKVNEEEAHSCFHSSLSQGCTAALHHCWPSAPKPWLGEERLRSCLVLRALAPKLPLLRAAQSSEHRVQNGYPEDETQSIRGEQCLRGTGSLSHQH